MVVFARFAAGIRDDDQEEVAILVKEKSYWYTKLFSDGMVRRLLYAGVVLIQEERKMNVRSSMDGSIVVLFLSGRINEKLWS